MFPSPKKKKSKTLEELHLMLAAEGSKNKDTVRCAAVGVLEVTGNNEANIDCVFVKKKPFALRSSIVKSQ